MHACFREGLVGFQSRLSFRSELGEERMHLVL
jgi:hypothetical protein